MSYARIIEDGCYIYPDTERAGIRIMFFPNEKLDFIPDTILDVLLWGISDEELNERRQHGKIVRDWIVENYVFTPLPEDKKSFFKWREKYVK